MSRVRQLAGCAVLAGLLAGGVAAPGAQAAGRVDRRGVYVLGGGAQYSLIEGESRYGLDFDKGVGYTLHFRYHLSRNVALVANFDNQRYGAVGAAPADPDSLVPDRFTFTAVHGGIRWFSIPGGDVLRYAEASLGFYRPELRIPKTQLQSISEGDIGFPPEDLLLHVGVGAEIFFTPAWAVDLGVHGYGLKGKGLTRTETPHGEKGFSVAGQIVVGIDYFLLR